MQFGLPCLWKEIYNTDFEAKLKENWEYAKGLKLSKAKAVISETKFGLLRPRPTLMFSQFKFRERVRDWNFLCLHFETESETGFFWVSMLRPSPRLDFSEPQYWDRVQDWNYLSLNVKTKSETIEFVETKTESLAILWYCLCKNVSTVPQDTWKHGKPIYHWWDLPEVTLMSSNLKTKKSYQVLWWPPLGPHLENIWNYENFEFWEPPLGEKKTLAWYCLKITLKLYHFLFNWSIESIHLHLWKTWKFRLPPPSSQKVHILNCGLFDFWCWPLPPPPFLTFPLRTWWSSRERFYLSLHRVQATYARFHASGPKFITPSNFGQISKVMSGFSLTQCRLWNSKKNV